MVQKAFKNFRVVPPGSGIVHQINSEYLASVIDIRDFKEKKRLSLTLSSELTLTHL